jgi:hypothetical protein
MPVPLQDEPPTEDHVTAYDEGHLRTYLRLLDARAADAPWEEAARLILDLDPVAEPERARMIYDRHLARAVWMTESGYRHLLEPPVPD